MSRSRNPYGGLTGSVGSAVMRQNAEVVAGALTASATPWWLMPPITAVYRAVTVGMVLATPQIMATVVVMVVEALLALAAAAHGARDGRRELAIHRAADERDEPMLLAHARGPARGHAVSLALCWLTTPLQTASYRTAWDQAASGLTRYDLADAAAELRGGVELDDDTDEAAPAAAATSRQAAPAAGPRAGAFLGWADDGTAVRANPRGATLVIGPPGQGKSIGPVACSVASAPGAVVSTSIKWDILQATHEVRTRVGRVWAFTPGGDESELPAGVTPVHWSPLDSVCDWESALTVATRLRTALPDSNDPSAAHWLDRATDWAAVLLFAGSLAGIDDFLKWTRRPAASTKAIREALAANPCTDTELALDALAAVVDDTTEKERSSIESTMGRLWQVYKLPGGVKVAQNPNFNPREFVTSRDALFIAVPAERTAVYAPAVVALIEAVRYAQYERHAALVLAGEPCVPLTAVLDEVANTAPIDLPTIASEAGGQGLHVVAALQDLAQARHRWGAQRGAGLLTIFGTKVLLPGIVDQGTLDALSAAIGDRRRGRLSTSTGADGRQSVSVSPERERIWPPSRIARLDTGRVLVIEGAQPREITGARWFAESDRIMEATK